MSRTDSSKVLDESKTEQGGKGGQECNKSDLVKQARPGENDGKDSSLQSLQKRECHRAGSGQAGVRAGQVKGKRVWRVVLTGGPCGGKTTAQARLSTFFESLGWRVYTVPEAATVLLNGGINFSVLSAEDVLAFQEDLVKVMFQLEDTFFRLAETSRRNCLVICDRGAMDCSAYLPKEDWQKILAKNNWNEVDIRDNRYNHVIHLISAARGAPEHYTRDNNTARTEDVAAATATDISCGESWVGHPYFDVVDNETDFETKMRKVTQCVSEKLGIEAEDWLSPRSVKLKFLVGGPLPPDDLFPNFIDFHVHHHYLQPQADGGEPRLRKRGRHNKWMYTHTVRRTVENELVETRNNISHKMYESLIARADKRNVPIVKTRRCFLWGSQYYQLDIYEEPKHGLMLLETYTETEPDKLKLPDFLDVKQNVTGQKQFSMYTLSLLEGTG